MSDIDYKQLFENGQLVWTEPIHREILDRMYQSFRGQPEEQIFKNKYQAYLAAVHPEALQPAVVAAPMPEPSIPEIAPEPVPDLIVEDVAPTPKSPVEDAPPPTDPDQEPAEEPSAAEIPEEKSSEKPKRSKRSISSPK